jgi:hypothetical protein
MLFVLYNFYQMAKTRRTRKQKEKAHHPFLIRWEPESNTLSSRQLVKRQFKNSLKKGKGSDKGSKNAKSKAKGEDLTIIKRDIVKSLSLAALILSLEVMIYLVWPNL